MKVIFERSILTQALTPAMSAVSSKNIIPATSGVLITTEGDTSVSITSYDLEKGVRVNIPATVVHEGSYVIGAVKLNQIIKALTEDEVTIEVDDKCKTKITSGRSEFSLPAQPGIDFPGIPELSGDYGFTVSQKDLKKMINRTLFATAQIEQRPIFCGVYFEVINNEMTAVSCDSFRLAYTKRNVKMENIVGDGNVNLKFIVPGKTLLELNKFLEDTDEEKVVIRMTRKHAIFDLNGLIFFTRLLEGQYIEYNRYIPKESTINVEVNTKELLSSLERAALISEEKAGARNFVKCNFKDNLLSITATAVSGNVYDEVLTVKEGDDIEICFTCRYLIEALRVCDVEKIKLCMTAPLRAMTIEPADGEDENEQFLFVTNPTRMK